jgi:hypothetical protein
MERMILMCLFENYLQDPTQTTSIESVKWRYRSIDQQGVIDSDPAKYGNKNAFFI